ncbi:MAG: hypothetical protein FD153_1950 [Rhodospirillaceae bacterium]|nr:MAG: hypothetical protein FD153_1950 [Rhodospirillaceae bacterium]
MGLSADQGRLQRKGNRVKVYIPVTKLSPRNVEESSLVIRYLILHPIALS